MLTIYDTKGNLLKEIEAENGRLLFDILTEAGYRINATCGGMGTCNKCKVNVDGEDVLSCMFKVNSSHKVTLPEYATEKAEAYVLTLSDDMTLGDNPFSEKVGAAIDIGTTTIAAYFYDLETKELIHVDSCLNPQAKHGADVISRIDYTINNNNGTKVMQALIISCLKKLLSRFDNISICVIAGNTTMLHFLVGEETKTIAIAPYVPVFTDAKIFTNDELGLGVEKVILTPSISAFIGGDITAGVLSTGMYKSDKNILLIDMGTNGEMVLNNRGKLIGASTACGPAFEGANIKYGMGGVTGAICKVEMKEDGALNVYTLGNEKARGICGSGLIDLIACLVNMELIDETGFMEEDFEVSPGIYLTTRDVREFQNAKAAIGAGIRVIAKHAGISLEEIDEVLLAGGFGSYIDINSAIDATLLPYEFRGKISSCGNSSGKGASQILLEESLLNAAIDISKAVDYIELANSKYFSDFYVMSMMFEQE